jgi:hypothetical protein
MGTSCCYGHELFLWAQAGCSQPLNRRVSCEKPPIWKYETTHDLFSKTVPLTVVLWYSINCRCCTGTRWS